MTIKEKLAKKYSQQFAGLGGAFEKGMYDKIMEVLTEYETILGCDSDFGQKKRIPKFLRIKCYADDEYRIEYLEEHRWSPLFQIDDEGNWNLDVTFNLETGDLVFIGGVWPAPHTDFMPDYEEGDESHIVLSLDNFKACDGGEYTLYDENLDLIDVLEGYVPCGCVPPYEKGYGDYIDLELSEDGTRITNLRPYSDINFEEFEENWE